MFQQQKRMTFQQAYDLYISGVLGTKEFRNWLAKQDPDFAAIRDADVDNQIDALARRREEALFPEVPQEVELPSDDLLDSRP